VTIFGFSSQVFIGDATSDDSDSFGIIVCLPSWFAEQVAAGQWERFGSGGLRALLQNVASGAGLWFLHRWDRAEFEDTRGAVCDTFSPAPDWGSVASRIGRLILWEFDDKYDQYVDLNSGPAFPP
jgi:hypothetical protein